MHTISTKYKLFYKKIKLGHPRAYRVRPYLCVYMPAEHSGTQLRHHVQHRVGRGCATGRALAVLPITYYIFLRESTTSRTIYITPKTSAVGSHSAWFMTSTLR